MCPTALISKNIWVETIETYLKDKEESWYEAPSNVIGIPLNAITGESEYNEKNMFIYYYVFIII